MIQTVFTAALPVGEQLVVRKHHLAGASRGGPRVAVVTGTHGDDLEGQFVAYELARLLRERPHDLKGTVDIYPTLNPLGLSAREHGVPCFDIDLDRTFPGNPNGNLTEALAHAVLEDILGANVCIDIRSSSVMMKEVTQIHVEEADSQVLVKLAALLNARLVWVRAPSEMRSSTMAHALTARGVPTLVVDMGVGMYLDENAGTWLAEGILRLLRHLRAWSGTTIELPPPQLSNGDNVVSVYAEQDGLFLSRVEHGSRVRRGQAIGLVADPFEGTVRREVVAPCEGLLFATRAYPVVYPGSLLGRILEDDR